MTDLETRIQAEANRKRSEAQKDVPKAEAIERVPTTSGQRSVTAAAKAAASKTNRGTGIPFTPIAGNYLTFKGFAGNYRAIPPEAP